MDKFKTGKNLIVTENLSIHVLRFCVEVIFVCLFFKRLYYLSGLSGRNKVQLYSCDSSTREVEVGRSGGQIPSAVGHFQHQPGQHETLTTTKKAIP